MMGGVRVKERLRDLFESQGLEALRFIIDCNFRTHCEHFVDISEGFGW
jgi:hypothetical protein